MVIQLGRHYRTWTASLDVLGFMQVPPDTSNVSEITASRLTNSFHMGLDRAGKLKDGAKIPSRVKGQYTVSPMVSPMTYASASWCPGASHQKFRLPMIQLEEVVGQLWAHIHYTFLKLGNSISRWLRGKSKVELSVVSVKMVLSVLHPHFPCDVAQRQGADTED